MNTEAWNRAKELFDAALGVPAAERADYVASQTRGDPALRREVEELLAAHELRGLGVESGGAGQLLAQLDGEQPGARIGPYRLLERIGEGGFGLVWMAEQDQPLRRQVALKVLKAGLDSKQVIARFEAERQALALMEHPSIARVFDAGATASGRPYFAMELVRGLPITEFCDQAKLSTDERLELFLQVCGAVQHAHHKGVIHRDLKPSNVLVTLRDGTAVPKVIDFGIAKALHGRLTDATLFTEFRQVLGTPDYMAPEQAGLSEVDVDTRADVYSLGVLLYELLTGTRPFEMRSLLQQNVERALRTLREVDPPRPSTRVSKHDDSAQLVAALRRTDPAALSARIRGDLDWIVMKALDKDRVRRYETASALADDVRRALTNEPVNARPPSASYRVTRFVRRHKLGVAAAALVGLSLLGGLISTSLALAQERDARHRSEEAELARAHSEGIARAEAQRARMGIDFMTSMLRSVGPAVAEGRDTALLREVLDSAARRVESELHSDPVIEAELRGVIGEVYRQLGEFETAETMLAASLELTLRSAPEDGLLVGIAHNNLGLVQYHRGELEAAEAHMREALRILELRTEDPAEHLLDTRSNFAALQLALGKPAEALALFESNVATLRTRAGPNDPMLAAELSNLAATQHGLGRFVEAEAGLREALAILGARGAGDSSDALRMRTNLAAVLRGQGKAEDAVRVLADSLSSIERVFGPSHPDAITAHNNLGAALYAVGRKDEAEREFARVLEERRRIYGERSAELIRPTLWRTRILRDRGEHARAVELLRECLAGAVESLGATHRETLGLRAELGATLIAAGDVDGAEAELADAWRDAAGLALEDTERTTVRRYLGDVLRKRGEFARAAEMLAGELRLQTESSPARAAARAELTKVLEAWEKAPGVDAARAELETYRDLLR